MTNTLDCKEIDPEDSIATMLEKLEELSKQLKLVRFSGSYKRSRSSDNGYVIRTAFWTEQHQGYVYSNDDVIKLQGHIQDLTSQLKNSQAELNEVDLKLLLSNTYNAIRTPTTSSLHTLYMTANSLSGKPNRLAQTGMVLLAIVGLICGVIPGILYIHHINKKDGLWDKNKRQGLSKAGMNTYDALIKTAANHRIEHGNALIQGERTLVNDELTVEPPTISVTSR